MGTGYSWVYQSTTFLTTFLTSRYQAARPRTTMMASTVPERDLASANDTIRYELKALQRSSRIISNTITISDFTESQHISTYLIPSYIPMINSYPKMYPGYIHNISSHCTLKYVEIDSGGHLRRAMTVWSHHSDVGFDGPLLQPAIKGFNG